jgi:peptidylprolyl isomerase
MMASSATAPRGLGAQRGRHQHPTRRYGNPRRHRAAVATAVTALLRVVAAPPSSSSNTPRRVTWDQSTDEVFVRVPVADDVRGRDVELEVHPTRLVLRVQGLEVLAGPVEGAGGRGGGLGDGAAIDVDGCFFTVEDRSGGALGRHVLVTLAKRTPGYMSWTELLEDDRPDDTVTRRVWLDVALRENEEGEEGSHPAERRGRLVFGLYGNATPRAVANFVALCTGEQREDGAGGDAAAGRDALHYLGTPFHRVIPAFMAQCGDTTFGDGTGGLSIYGDAFEDEPGGLRLAHASRGVLAMANAGPGTNSSQFYVTFRAAPHLDGKHVVFGKVEAGGEVLAALEAIGTPSGATRGRAVVVGCGAMREGATGRDAQAWAADMPLQEVLGVVGGVGGDDAAEAWLWEQYGNDGGGDDS